jgi:hypothetical protein
LLAAYGDTDRIALGERHLLVAAVDRRAAAEHEVRVAVLDLLQQDLGAGDVDVHVAHRVLDRRAHSRQRRQVHDGVDPGQRTSARRSIADVPLQELQALLARRGQLVEIAPLQRDVVERIEVVEHAHTIPRGQQPLAEM